MKTTQYSSTTQWRERSAPFILTAGFTLIETLVAITLLTVSIVAPMSLAEQSLQSAYYARDQITASYLAQDAIESVREIRDSNIIKIAEGQSVGILSGIDTTGAPFTVDDSHNIPASTAACLAASCPVLQTNGVLYGYFQGWTNTPFTRTLTVTVSPHNNGQVHLIVTVSWKTGAYQAKSFSLSEDLFSWVNQGTAN